MCGICGSTDNNAELLHRMCDSLVHRGPDAFGEYYTHWDDTYVQFGIRRLSIVDLDAKQPVFNEDKQIAAVMNGEIYNYVELKEELVGLGHVFVHSHSDTELIPHLYEMYGVDWPLRVNGMFSVAVYDNRTKEILLFRDRIGKKPLYYSFRGKFFAFASEIKALLRHPNISDSLNYTMLGDYFAKKSTTAPYTIYKDILQLEPGTCLRWKDGNISTSKYWSTQPGFVESLTKGETIEKFLYLFRDSVSIRTRCDVPFGAYLSGGMDSSSVVSMLSRLGKRVKTFCLGYDTATSTCCSGKAKDVEYARKLSSLYGTDHHEIIITANDFKEALPAIIAAFDEPFSGTVSTYFVSKLIKDHAKVALSGDGADELFGSYLSHRLANSVYKILRGAPKALQEGITWRKSLFVFIPEEAKLLLNAGLHDVYRPNVRDFQLDKDPINQVLDEDQNDLLPNQVLPFVDRLSMAHSVEVRCPYLDYRIIELINNSPGTWKICGETTKALQKAAFGLSVLPLEIVDREKEGFVQPIYAWMLSDLSNWIDELLAELPYHILNRSYVESLTKERDAAKIWNLACFSLWWNK